MTTSSLTAIPQGLYDILDKQLRVAGDLCRILEEERTALTGMDISAILATSQRKIDRIERLHELDQAFLETARTLLGLEENAQVRLADLISRAPARARERLSQARNALRGLRERILDQNAVNRRFAEESRKFLGEAISLITSSISEQTPAYTKAKCANKARATSTMPKLISREV